MQSEELKQEEPLVVNSQQHHMSCCGVEKQTQEHGKLLNNTDMNSE